MTYRTYRTHATYTPARLLLLLWLILDSSAREPIPAPPKVETQTKTVRARDLAIPFDGIPGKFNAITDVPGVEVGYTTLISGEGKLEVGKGPVRTGVTAILPRGREAMNDPVFAGYFSLNGNGEMTGTAWVEERGFLEGPIVLTNTHSVGVARDAVIAWRLAHGGPDAEGLAWCLPLVAGAWVVWLSALPLGSPGPEAFPATVPAICSLPFPPPIPMPLMPNHRFAPSKPCRTI